jgi:aspartyl-tRNA(Asn)/glutamyl-tRNA(Gln) amidotransferase subunit A
MNWKQSCIAEVETAVRHANPSATGLAELCFEEIEAQNPAINAFLAVSRERALRTAAAIDQLAAQGDPLPALAGVPIGVKDVLVMEGSPATAGSRILEGYRPLYDPTVVKRLEAAGAVLVGKLNCDEFGMGSSTENSGYGPVRNPVARDQVPGGSSGGSAAAVAAGMAVATLGTDTGGSVHRTAVQ